MAAALQPFPLPGFLSLCSYRSLLCLPPAFGGTNKPLYDPLTPSFLLLVIPSPSAAPDPIRICLFSASLGCSQGWAGSVLLMQSWDLAFLTSGESEKSVLLIDSSLCVSSVQPGPASSCVSVGSQALHFSVLLIRGAQQTLPPLPACPGLAAGKLGMTLVLFRSCRDLSATTRTERSVTVPITVLH